MVIKLPAKAGEAANAITQTKNANAIPIRLNMRNPPLFFENPVGGEASRALRPARAKVTTQSGLDDIARLATTQPK
jgi:hypothetical protein